MRVLHPLLACFMVCAAVLVALRFARTPRCRPAACTLGALALSQVALGALNIAFNAPGWLQLAHLLVAQLTWISALLLAFAWRSAAGSGD